MTVTLPNISTGRSEKKLLAISADQSGNVLAIDERSIKTSDTVSSSFSDVPDTFWAYRDIQRAYAKKLINGFTDGTFRPNRYVARRHAVMMMDRLFHWPLARIRSPFADTSLELAGALSIYSAYDEQVVKGYNDGKFYPETFLTRAQMAIMLARALHLSEHSFSGTTYPFKDLAAPNHFAYYAVQQLAAKGIITKQAYFRPNERLTRAQMAAMLMRAYDYLHRRVD